MPDWRAKLDEINKIIFAKGAPLGSDGYWRIREITAEATRSISAENKSDQTP